MPPWCAAASGSRSLAREANFGDPFANQPRVLSGAQVARRVDAAGKGKVLEATAEQPQPCQQARARWLEQFELNRSAGLLLNDHCAVPDLAATHQVADRDRNHIAAAQFAVDGEIEQGAIPQTALVLEGRSV
jgi:hypothetical protein